MRLLSDGWATFSAEPETCLDQDAQLCPSIALPDLFGGEHLSSWLIWGGLLMMLQV